MAKQTFTTGQVLTAAQMTSLQQTAMGGGAATAKTASYVLVAADAGTTVAMNAAGATTITVNTGLFAAGDTVFIQNLGAGACTVTAGTATVATAGSLILPQNDAGILYFTSASAAIFYDYIQAGAVSPLTTKGDLYTFSTSDARLGVGANGTTLVADSSEATGLKWATAASGGMTLIAETVATASTGITYSSLGSYKQLLLMWSHLNYSANGVIGLRFNNNSGNVYEISTIIAQDGTGSADKRTVAYVEPGWSLFGQSVTSTTTADRGYGYILIDNYTSTTRYKSFNGRSSWRDNQYSNTISVDFVGSFLDSATAITTLDIYQHTSTPTFTNQTGGSFRLYGLS